MIKRFGITLIVLNELRGLAVVAFAWKMGYITGVNLLWVITIVAALSALIFIRRKRT